MGTNKKKTLDANEESKEVSGSLDNLLAILHELSETSQNRLDSIFVIQKSLTNLILNVDKVISEINHVELELQKDYLVFDSPALWEYGEIDSIASDTF